MTRLKMSYRLMLFISVWLLVTVPAAAQNTVSEDIRQPEFTCQNIPFPVTTEANLVSAIDNANDEVTCPGADVIDLGGNAVTLTAALPQITSSMTIQNGTITRSSTASAFRLIDHNNPGGTLNLIDLFLSNGEASLGAAVYNVGGLVNIEGSSIWNNTSNFGAVRVFDSDARISISDSSFNFNNSINLGGALALAGGAQSYIVNSTFTENTATNDGGAVHINTGANLLMINVSLRGNEANNGGAIYSNGETDLINVLMSGNLANSLGGGIYVVDDAGVSEDLELLNVTIAGNRAVDLNGGGGIRMESGDADVDNTIVWENLSGTTGGFSSDNVTVNTTDATIGFSRSVLEGGLPNGAFTDNANYFTDPFFRDPVIPTSSNTPNSDGNYRFWREVSSATNNGNNFDIAGGRSINNIADDLDRTTRIQGGDVDVGAYEGGASAAGFNLVSNGTFNSGITNWLFFGQGSRSVVNNELRFFRNPGFQTATLFQNIDTPVPNNAKLEVTFDIGNASGVSKGVEMLLRTPNFSDNISCAVTIPPNTAPQTVTVRGITDELWNGMVISFRAYDPDGIPAIRLDNVSVEYVPSAGFTNFSCSGFPAPANSQLLKNGFFGAGLQYWKLFGGFDFNIAGGVMNFWRTSGSANPAVLFQDQIGHHLPANAPTRLSFLLGNSSNVTKNVQVSLRDVNYVQNVQCNYAVPPNTPLTQVIVQLQTNNQWSRPYVTIRATNADSLPAVRVDNVNLQYIPSLTIGTNCPAPAFPSPTIKPPTTLLPDNGIVPDNGGNSAPAPVAPPNPGGIPEIPGF